MGNTKTTTTMTDCNGAAVPLRYVSQFDRLRDRNVRAIHRDAAKLRKTLEAFVRSSVVRLDEIANCRESLGDRGNFSSTSFDGLIRAGIRQQYVILLDERVIRARELMVGYMNSVLDRISGNDGKALRLMIDEAFRANARGILSTAKILSLLRMEIDNDDWREAKRILQDSLRPQKGKRYLFVEFRTSHQSDFQPIRLDISDCFPDFASTFAKKEAENV